MAASQLQHHRATAHLTSSSQYLTTLSPSTSAFLGRTLLDRNAHQRKRQKLDAVSGRASLRSRKKEEEGSRLCGACGMPQVAGWTSQSRVESVKTSRERRGEKRSKGEEVKSVRKSKRRRPEWGSKPQSMKRKGDGEETGDKCEQVHVEGRSDEVARTDVAGQACAADPSKRPDVKAHQRRKVLVTECLQCARLTKTPLPAPLPAFRNPPDPAIETMVNSTTNMPDLQTRATSDAPSKPNETPTTKAEKVEKPKSASQKAKARAKARKSDVFGALPTKTKPRSQGGKSGKVGLKGLMKST